MIQLSLGSLVNWLSRAGSGLVALFAFCRHRFAARVTAAALPLGKSRIAYYRSHCRGGGPRCGRHTPVFLSALGVPSPLRDILPCRDVRLNLRWLARGPVATALSAIFADYFWIGPGHQFVMGAYSDWLAIMIFLLSGRDDRMGFRCHAPRPRAWPPR